VLGIDDWAWRKGHRYGTILCDLETRKVVDLLHDRDANTVASWLRQHPGTEIISRDRGRIYAEAARRAAPQVVQVADRWHLLRNLSEALCRAIFTTSRPVLAGSKGQPSGGGMNDGNRCGNSSSRQALLIRNSHGSSAWITEL
jgi:transposase